MSRLLKIPKLEKVKDKLGARTRNAASKNESSPRASTPNLKHEQPIIAKLSKKSPITLCDECKNPLRPPVKRELETPRRFFFTKEKLAPRPRSSTTNMRTTFEITAQGLGSQNAVCGGGPLRRPSSNSLAARPTKGHRLCDRPKIALILSLQEAKDQSLVTSHRSPFVYRRMDGRKRLRRRRPRRKKISRAAGVPRRAASRRAKIRPRPLERASKLGAQYGPDSRR